MRFLITLATVLFATPSVAQTFTFTPTEIIQRYNNEQKKEEADTLTSCNRSASDTTCRFTNKAFLGAVQTLKQLNLINGNFPDKGKVIFTEENGKVSYIIVSGDRGDPANLFQTIGRITGMLTTLGMKDTEAKTMIPKLGLMRGDDDPTIGTATTNIEDYAAIKCNSQNSHKTTAIGCVFTPRY